MTLSPADVAFDRDHLWHPYSSATAPGPVYPVSGAEGVRLRLQVDGAEREVIDAMSSWWCAVHGYAVPELDAALREQAASMSHVMFGGLTHRPAVELGRRLVEMVGLPHVFLADSGSIAVEVAMKMALQARPGRTRFLTVRGGYHGDTFNPMSVCDPEGGMHALWSGLLPEHLFAPLPPTGLDPDPAELARWSEHTRDLFRAHAGEVAAVIVEPVLQGAGGMRIWAPAAVDLLTELAHEHGALVIHDEIATGFWRTGTAFAADRLHRAADIVCVGKALTGGYLTLGATLCSAAVAREVSDSPAGAMMHGPTFMGNPLACAVAVASLDLLAGADNAARIGRIERRLADGLSPAADLPHVREVRTLGAVGVIQVDRPVDLPRVTRTALEHGVWVRPFRDLIYTMPPFVTSDDDLAVVTSALLAAAREAGR